MAESPAPFVTPDQFTVPVSGVGEFVFRRRSMGVQMAIECEYSRRTEGLAIVSEFCARLASRMSDLHVMTVRGPEGWDLDELDGFDEEDFAKIGQVWSALRDKEAEFRRLKRETARPANGGNSGVPVPPPVQPAAD